MLAESAEMAEQTDTETDAFLFLEGARNKMQQYRGKSLKGTLEYGDYIGINADATLDIHQIGLIRGIQLGADNQPKAYTVEKFDGSVIVVKSRDISRLY